MAMSVTTKLSVKLISIPTTLGASVSGKLAASSASSVPAAYEPSSYCVVIMLRHGKSFALTVPDIKRRSSFVKGYVEYVLPGRVPTL